MGQKCCGSDKHTFTDVQTLNKQSGQTKRLFPRGLLVFLLGAPPLCLFPSLRPLLLCGRASSGADPALWACYSVVVAVVVDLVPAVVVVVPVVMVLVLVMLAVAEAVLAVAETGTENESCAVCAGVRDPRSMLGRHTHPLQLPVLTHGEQESDTTRSCLHDAAPGA